MTLDVPTLMLAGAFVCALCGGFLFSVWWQHREPAAVWWAAGLLANGIARRLARVRLRRRSTPLFVLGLILLIAAPALIWCGLRLVLRRAGLVRCRSLAGFALWFAAARFRRTLDGVDWAPTVTNTLIAGRLLCATIWELLRRRSERLRARIPLVVLTVPYMLIFLLAIPAALDGDLLAPSRRRSRASSG